MPSTSLQDVTKDLRDRYLALSQDYKVQNPGKSLVVTCTARTPAEQLAAYQQGRSFRDGKWVVEDPSKIITQLSGEPGHQSYHNYTPAQAIDVCVCIGGKVTWNDKEYLALGPLAQKHGLEWGGSWPHFKDYPHLQLPQKETV